MATEVSDLALSLDRGAFARELGLEPDGWQEDLLRSASDRVLLNCARQSGKSSVSAIIALHRALYFPGSLVLVLAPAERQAKETFGKVATHYRELGYPVSSDSYRKLGMELSNGSRVEALPGMRRRSAASPVWIFSSSMRPRVSMMGRISPSGRCSPSPVAF